tara:strand:- start:55 stop:576 length:522 start_codon:yes stop_codon:yes gene_type:complete
MKKNLLVERFQQLAGIKPLYGNKLNETLNILPPSGHKQSEEFLNGASLSEAPILRFNSIANSSQTGPRLDFEYQFKGEDGKSTMIYARVGTENTLSLKTPPDVDQQKATEFATKIMKPGIIEVVERILKMSDAKEYLGKAHIGGGYEDSVKDEDGVGLRNGLQEFKNVSPKFM